MRIEAWDDAGARHAPATLRIGAHASVQFNSADLIAFEAPLYRVLSLDRPASVQRPSGRREEAPIRLQGHFTLAEHQSKVGQTP